MVFSRVLSRVPRGLFARCRNSGILCSRPQPQYSLSLNHFYSIHQSPEDLAGSKFPASVLQSCGISSSTSQSSAKEQGRANEVNVSADAKIGGDSEDNDSADTETSRDSKHLDRSDDFLHAEAPDGTKREEVEDELSTDDMVKLLIEKQELLKMKQEEIKSIKDKFLRGFAEMENVTERTKREAENSMKFAIQSFAKDLLDVADTLERASSMVSESFTKIDASKDTAGAVPLLKTLLEGVQMTDKQLVEVFRKFGVEKFDPANEKFDPHWHNAAFQVPDASKPPGTIAAVLKAGYSLHDRVIRPAEVGVTMAIEGDEASQGSGAMAGAKASGE